MSAFGPLSDDEVQQIVSLIQTLEQSNLDYLQLELGDMKLTIGKGEFAGPAAAAPAPPAPPAVVETAAASPAAPAGIPAAAAPNPPPAPAPAAPAAGEAGVETADTVTIRAPIVGRFYAQPEPGAPPFVTVGAAVDEDTTVGLIEVMKVFNAVRAGVRGVITEICVQDAQFVEYDQPLFRVRLPNG